MKKLLLVLVAVLSMTACTTEEYNTYSKPFIVTNRMWDDASDATGNYLYYTFDLPQLSSYVFNKGVMEAYLYYVPKGTNESVLSPLPFSDFIVEEENDYKFEEHITVEFAVGSVTFILKPDDHDVSVNPFYSEYEFVVRLLW